VRVKALYQSRRCRRCEGHGEVDIHLGCWNAPELLAEEMLLGL
jgi:hypothetical protein